MLRTEMRNPNTYKIGEMSTVDILKTINRENENVISAIDKTLAEIEMACDAVSEAIKNGGRVFYIGAGTSGRLGVCDAAECPPTFGVPKDMFTGIIAGGYDCMHSAAENAEDDPNLSVEELKKYNFNEKDIVIGVSASGSAAYVISAIRYAKEIGAKSVSITNNPDTLMGKTADINICADTGPEVITGSTRMKAGTSQKIILNMISTTAMVKRGYVYENLMINLKPTNKKLRNRMIEIVCDITKFDYDKSEKALDECEWSIPSVKEKYERGLIK